MKKKAPASSSIQNPGSSIEGPSSLGATAPKLKVVFVGHVDHGKSTLIGRILHDTGSIEDGKIEMIEKACAAEGMEFEFAFLLDALLEEQEQNVTIDTTRIRFRTARRPYVIIDAPGHKEFLKNMITGAASADAAILVIAASEGVREQSRRHAYLLGLLGIKQLIVVVNKMDLADYAEKRFREIEAEYRKFLIGLDLNPRVFRSGLGQDRRKCGQERRQDGLVQGADRSGSARSDRAQPGGGRSSAPFLCAGRLSIR